MQWLSRTIAVVIVMVGPGLVGAALDRHWGSSFWTPAGFLLGMALATTALVALAQKLAPPGRGKPLPFDNDDDDEPPASDEPKM
ncbi:MAG: AtpZ/AtpI family protein [Pirellulaceae bacterium]|jgi:hypothetical protein|nr:AtpZ/AtpI family protein [Pirellulaceae bacterium]